MVQMTLFLDYKRNSYVVEAAKEMGMNKHDLVLQCIDRAMEADLQDSQEQSLKDQEFKELNIGGVN
jgi:hypothetical protein